MESMLDPVTRFFSRHAVDQLLARESERLSRVGGKLLLLFATLKSAPKEKLTEGNVPSDARLSNAAAMLEKVFCSAQFIARFDDFTLLTGFRAPEKDVSPIEVVHRLNRNVEAWNRAASTNLELDYSWAVCSRASDVTNCLQIARQELSVASAEKRPAGPGVRPVCLLVDCSDATVDMFRPLLNTWNVCTGVCNSPTEAASIVSRSKVDSVVLECSAPETGLVAIEMLRSLPPGANMIVVAVIQNRDIADQCLRAGANFVLSRPFDPEITYRTLRAAYGLMLAERRRYFRHPVDVPVELTDSSGIILQGKMKNVSDHGMAVKCMGKLRTHDKVVVSFAVPGSTAVIRITGQIVWANAGGTAGIRLFSTEGSAREHMAKWLSRLAAAECGLAMNRAEAVVSDVAGSYRVAQS